MANIDKARSLFTSLVELDGNKDRSAQLALLELEKRARTRGMSNGRCIILRGLL
jgi:hypothetical protein